MTIRRLIIPALLAAYLVVRAVVEIVTVDPSRPATYRHDWGGPHYLGVMLVHVGPGILAIALAIMYYRRQAGSSGRRSRALSPRRATRR